MVMDVEARIFVQLITFQEPSSIFFFMVFTQVFMKVLARILIHDGSLQLQSVFKMLLPIYLAIVEKELCI